MMKDIGMIDELVLADPTLPRFVYWEGKLFALPGALQDLVKFDLLTCNTPIFFHQS
jgi:protoporphyrinogen/coproporphyrinogen III oxidase